MTTPAEAAIYYILNRVVNDRDFSWHMMGTQSLRLCIKAEAAARNRTEDQVERTLHRQMEEAQLRLERNGCGKSQLVAAREKLEAIREAIRERADVEIDPAIVEHIEAIIDGRKPRAVAVTTIDGRSEPSSTEIPSWLS